MMPTISIALATYNGEPYIEKQLESLLAQTRLPDELIICDDCSSDNTPHLLNSFKKNAPFKVSIHLNRTNLGYSANFSKVLSLCSGDIVLLSDQDDFWLPQKIETIENYFSNQPESQLIIHDIAFCKKDLTPIGQTKIERMYRSFNLMDSYVVGMASAIRLDFLKLCLPIPQFSGITHDNWLHSCAAALNRKTIIKDVLALHRRHNDNATCDNILNVDYITKPYHYNLRNLNLISRFKEMRNDSLLRYNQSFMLIKWLETHSELIRIAGYAEHDFLISKVAIKHKECNAIMLRHQIISKDSTKCLGNIIKLCRSDGYKFFHGWKSVLNDLVFRFIFRL